VNRHRAYFPLDDAPQPDGDGAFVGVDALKDPAQLGDGEMAYAENARFDHGRAETRGGCRIMTWGAKRQVGDGISTVRPFGDVVTAGAFADPIAGFEWLIIVTTAGAWRTRAGNQATAIPVQAGQSVATATDLIQTYNGLVLLRGRTEAPLYLKDLDEGFLALPQPQRETEAIPPATRGIYVGNRLFVVDARTAARYVDSIWASDIGGVSSVLQGEDIYQSFKVNQGSSDRLVALYKFNDTTLVAAKERSIYVVSGVSGTNVQMAASARLDEVTRQYGCIAPGSFVQVGSDVWFLGHRRGVCSLRQTETNAIQGVDVPVSRPVQPLIDRIAWEYASGVVAAAHENRVYFAVPIDGSHTNNAVLVFSTLTQRWCGFDTGAALKVKQWVKFTYAGAVRLGYVSTDGFVYLCEDGDLDHLGDANGNITVAPIVLNLVTRGYGGRVAGNKRFLRAVLRTRTLFPSYTVSTRSDGVRETRVEATITKDRTKYHRPHGRAPWVTTNVNNDFLEPYRQDYAAIPPIAVHADSGFAVGVHQEFEEALRISRRGQYLQLEINNTRGRLELAGVALETQRGSTRSGSDL
jgi:hypothetical protein